MISWKEIVAALAKVYSLSQET
jgi:hypothetical protein